MPNNFSNLKNHDFDEDEKSVTIETLYPDLTSEEQRAAEYFLTRYVKVIRRIFEKNNAN